MTSSVSTFVTCSPANPVKAPTSAAKVDADTTFLTMTALFSASPQKIRTFTIDGNVWFLCAVTC